MELRIDIGERMRLVEEIASREGVSRSDALGLLLTAGLRYYRLKHRVRCGYKDCTRKDCCGMFGRGTGKIEAVK